MSQNITVKLNHLHIAPRKTRFVADLIRGLPVGEAEAQLMHSPRRASGSLIKLLHSAVANAKNNSKIEPSKLYIKEIRVDGGPTLRRFMPRAFGRVSLIEKKTSHVTLVLGVREEPFEQKFVMPEKPKKKAGKDAKKKKKQEKTEPEPQRAVSEEKQAKPGFLKRMFRRKTV